MKSEAGGQFEEKLETGEAPAFPENMRDLELKEISSGDVVSVDASEHLGCRVEEGHDGSEGSDDESEEEDEDSSDSSSENSEGEDDCSDEDEEENQDEESENFWNLEQLEILKSALPSFHFLPRTTVDKIVTELKVGDQLSKSRNIDVSCCRFWEGVLIG